ncbi:hypothetical protein C8R26_11381 [Nitrosomonas oligotropha]|uniref:Uncharacterized protein n=1 Tax=Nitrosomonas oligotropha TaxID=42354 RepID=A0A2T5HZ32_9PROT|nr:hypothetical protein [Nitrosomonas oligotropha]PTQ76833.1 hypothetical protein C8R26_11381 [Nitrosomonas oligotropha]
MSSKADRKRISEAEFEDGVVAALAGSPFYRQRPAEAFDATLGLDIAETAAFIQTTQPKEWAKLSKQFPAGEQAALAAQLATLLQKRGTLEVLRNGVSFNGINLQLAYFRPSAGGNPEHQARYEANRFAVMSQVHSSTKAPTSRWMWWYSSTACRLFPSNSKTTLPASGACSRGLLNIGGVTIESCSGGAAWCIFRWMMTRSI